jgi:predicted alpha/beta hydrolase family esterase
MVTVILVAPPVVAQSAGVPVAVKLNVLASENVGTHWIVPPRKESRKKMQPARFRNHTPPEQYSSMSSKSFPEHPSSPAPEALQPGNGDSL